jgi:hypothetical protein
MNVPRRSHFSVPTLSYICRIIHNRGRLIASPQATAGKMAIVRYRLSCSAFNISFIFPQSPGPLLVLSDSVGAAKIVRLGPQFPNLPVFQNKLL